MLFADGIGDVPWWVPVATTLAPLVFIAWDKLRGKSERSQQASDQKRQVRKDTIEEFQVLLNRQAQDLEELKKEYKAELKASRKREEDCQSRVGVVEREYERAVSRMEHMEFEMKRNGLDYAPWVDRAATEQKPAGEGE